MIKRGELSFGWLPWAFAICFYSRPSVLPESVDGFISCIATWIDIFGKPFTEFVSHDRDASCIFGQIYEILCFVRIFCEMIKLMGAIRIAMDIFPFARTDHANGAVFVENNHAVISFIVAGEKVMGETVAWKL